jgi:hypothetical protein
MKRADIKTAIGELAEAVELIKVLATEIADLAGPPSGAEGT